MVAATAFAEKQANSTASAKPVELDAYRVADLKAIVTKTAIISGLAGMTIVGAFNYLTGNAGAYDRGVDCAFEASRSFVQNKNAGKDQIAQIIYVDDMARCGKKVQFTPAGQ